MTGVPSRSIASPASSLEHLRTVLLVEDNAGDALLVRQMLGEAWVSSFELVHVDSLHRAQEHLSAHPASCVLLDLGLPDATGVDVVARVRERAPETPIIVLTGLDDEELALEALQQGAQDYLTKNHLDSRLLARAVRYAMERKKLEQEIAFQALHDPLTGLANRPLLLEDLASALRRSRRSGQRVALFFVDLDRFKSINDTYGHAAGDLVLSATARRLRDAVRPGDTVARLGGDEFAIVCDGIPDEAVAATIAARVGECLSQPVTVAGRRFSPRASVGIALGSAAVDPDALLRDADAALYRAKELGRGRVEMYDEQLRRRLHETKRIEAELSDAVRDESFVLHYQPQVDVASGAVVGYEALVRWAHPERGLLAPAEFLAVAEDDGCIHALGTWVFREACAQAARWSAAVPERRPHVAVNLSPAQLHDRSLAAAAEAAVRAAGVAPSSLCVEVTEAALASDGDAAADVLASLKDVGVRVAIDHFGAGYSSIAQLRRLPLDVLKVDRSFVPGDGNGAERVAAAVVDLAHSLHMRALIEGVETDAQWDAVRATGCDEAQGFLLGRPAPASAIDPAAPGRRGRRADA
ncbi:MAG TPA: EAL domain-containing protein [Actinomycetota bacterium]|nr:EAL domain-containing protein [Actinomycetota bacterium]